MEHILQFGISIDDERIKNSIEQAALKQLTDKLVEDVSKVVFEWDAWGRKPTNRATDWTKRRFDEFLEAHKDEILKEASRMLADKLARTKAAKALLEGGEA